MNGVTVIYLFVIAAIAYFLVARRRSAKRKDEAWVSHGSPVVHGLRQFGSKEQVGATFGPGTGLAPAAAIVSANLALDEIRRMDREICLGLGTGLRSGELDRKEAFRVMGVDARGLSVSGASEADGLAAVDLGENAFAFIEEIQSGVGKNVSRWDNRADVPPEFLAWHVIMVHRLSADGVVGPVPW